MSILIKGMDMPRYCDECKMLYDCASCMVLEKTIDWETSHERRRDDCPLVEVKAPHGRLGDLDALESEGADLCCDNGYYGSTEWGFSYEMIENAPTIIEAEGKEDG